MKKAEPNAEAETAKQEAAIDGLIRHGGFATDEVRFLYDSVLAEMKKDATIADFLPIFAARKVREILLFRKLQIAT